MKILTITEDLNHQSDSSFLDVGDDVVDVVSRNDPAVTIAQMIELFGHVDQIAYDNVPRRESQWQLDMLGLFGMAGIGKTTLAREIFDDPTIMSHFDHRVWITLGPRYQSENILADILTQIDPNIDKMHIMKGDEMLGKQFWKAASCQRCLIVLDDVWSKDTLCYVDKLYKEFKFEVLLTTMLKEVADYAEFSEVEENCTVHKMRLLNKDESWCFLREKVFPEKFCPPDLEKAGKIIAEKCEGLPLMITEVANLLSEAEKTPEYWTNVAEKRNLLFEHAYGKISEMLYPTYEYMPQYLKASFLYMGVFPKKYEVPTSKLLKLWRFEGIIEPSKSKTLEELAMDYVTEVVSRSLLMAGKTSSSSKIKTSRLHSVYWHLCVTEARKNKFFHVLNRRADGSEEYLKCQRRLSVQNNILFAIKDVYNSMASTSTAHSLLCTGPPHQYPVPICLGLRLLRVLDALAIRFYDFPIEAMHLIHLRYFGLTYDGKLPPSISKLRNLECLIVHQHLNTKLHGVPLFLPEEIWDMKELKHLQVMGSDLPNPCCSILPNLVTLLDISANSCINGVLQGTPNLKKLGIRIELTPGESEPMFSFDHISHLDRLESLKCVVVNPELIRSGIAAPPPPILSLPSSLVKLSLSGFGYPWECMKKIAYLPNLEVLKLRCFAFRGPVWEMRESQFGNLRYLLLEDSDLEYLIAYQGWLPCVWHFNFRHCYNLKEFPQSLSIRQIELLDCSPSASRHVLDKGLSYWANIHSSWEK